MKNQHFCFGTVVLATLTRMHTHMHMHMRTHTHMRTHMHMRTHTHTHMHMPTHMHMHPPGRPADRPLACAPPWQHARMSKCSSLRPSTRGAS